jgi:hypothetical protein
MTSLAKRSASVFTICLLAFGAATLAGCGGGSSGASNDETSGALETHGQTDAETQAKIEQAAQGVVYISESDVPWTWATANGHGISDLTADVIIEKFGQLVDNPEHKQLHAKAAKFDGFFQYDDCQDGEYPGPAECAKDKILHDALDANLKKLKVFYVAPYANPSGDGTPTIFIVGFTPAGNIGAVWTTAVWT